LYVKYESCLVGGNKNKALTCDHVRASVVMMKGMQMRLQIDR
jgi:hypothetical protein